MNRAIQYFIIVFLFVTACTEQAFDNDRFTSKSEITFSAKSIESLSQTPIADKTTYSFLAYQNKNPLPIGQGSYRYDASNSRSETLIPCTFNENNGAWIEDQNSQGLQLAAGNYQVAIVSPAGKSKESGGARYFTYSIDRPFYAVKPFDISVTGYQIFPIPPAAVMQDLRARIDLVFKQMTEIGTFTITNLQFNNRGDFADYYPLSGVSVVDRTTSNPIVPIHFTPTGQIGIGKTIYSLKEEHIPFIFSSDYTREDIDPVILSFDIVVAGKPHKIEIPLVYRISSMKTYQITIEVQSMSVDISLRAIAWNDGYHSSGDETIGGAPPKIQLGSWLLTDDTWIPNNLDNESIGEQWWEAITTILPKSNCYILKPSSGYYAIPVSQANADEGMSYYSGGNNIPRRLNDNDPIEPLFVWSDKPGTLTSNGVINYLAIVKKEGERYLLYHVGNQEGNVVAAVISNNTIKWSWHLWITNYDPEQTNNQEQYAGQSHPMMNRNLGALYQYPNSNTDPNYCMGLIYQWGRKDPFPAHFQNWNNDDLEPTIFTSGAAGTEWVVKQPVEAILPNDVNLENAISNPLSFYYNVLPPFDWYTNYLAYSNPELWKPNTKTPYDPCPVGWKVPPSAVWSDLQSNYNYRPGYSQFNKGDQGNRSFGVVYDPEGNVTNKANPVYYPAGGLRLPSSGNFSGITSTGVSTSGYYWSCERSGTGIGASKSIEFTASIISQSNTHYRSHGGFVRCIKE